MKTTRSLIVSVLLIACAQIAVAQQARHRAVTPCSTTSEQLVEKFESAAQAYAFAASRCDTRLVMRVDHPTLHYVVVVGGGLTLVGSDVVFSGNVIAPSLVVSGSAYVTNVIASNNVYAAVGFQVLADQVVGARGAAVADATDAASAITQLNLLLARVREHGLIAK